MAQQSPRRERADRERAKGRMRWMSPNLRLQCAQSSMAPSKRPAAGGQEGDTTCDSHAASTAKGRGSASFLSCGRGLQAKSGVHCEFCKARDLAYSCKPGKGSTHHGSAGLTWRGNLKGVLVSGAEGWQCPD